MLAARLLRAGGPLVLEEVAIPVPSGTEVRVRVAGCGLCRTDLHILAGTQPRVTPPITLGHEIAGWVDAVGPGADAPQPGTPVLVFGGWGCGECRECLAGEEQRCERGASPGFQRDGGYAAFVLVPSGRYLVPIPGIDPIHAAPLADAGVTPYRAVRRAAHRLRAGGRVLLIGYGGLGQFALQYLLRHPDVAVEVRDLDAGKVARARRAGAVASLGGAADVAFDFVGTDRTLAECAAEVAPGGLISLVGEAGGSLRFGFDRMPVEASVTTTAWGSLADLRDVAALAGELRWDVEKVPLSRAASAFERLAAGRVDGRLVLVP